ncbi:MAG: hypothetical protein LBG80_11045 [Bacteroidales bacterium]|jgi:hypothetical protein|nr:hypothetical protein [Bacteroidales bacterium]
MAGLLNIKEASEWATSDIIFALTVEDIQYEAREVLKRELTNEEITIVKKGLAWGLLTNIDTVYNTIFKEMI